MIDIRSEEEKKITCLLVGSPVQQQNENTTTKELEGLVKTLGLEVVGTITLARIEPNPVYGIGKGKAEEIAAHAKAIAADCIVFDFNIEPTKQRNWEKLSSIPVFDRQEVILRIFAKAAQTKEAVLQVELAKLTYSLPRLAHTYGDMSRQRGGSYGSKGSGETQLELDRRAVEARILQVKKELLQVSADRETQRKKRDRIALQSCALVGYTNAGKSSLLNALTGAEAYVADKLFATLDPTTRKLPLQEGGSILITDTVGFISNLPHSLIDAFKSTLEEAVKADLLLIVIDASDSDAEKQYSTVQHVLEEIGAASTPRLIILNKMDRLTESDILFARLDTLFPSAIRLSAKTQEGFTGLLARICNELNGEEHDYIIPLERQELVSLVRKTGIIEKEEWKDTTVNITARAGSLRKNGGRTLALLAPYLVK